MYKRPFSILMIVLILFNLLLPSAIGAANQPTIQYPNNSVTANTYSPSVGGQLDSSIGQATVQASPNVTHTVYDAVQPNSGVVDSTYGNAAFPPTASLVVPNNNQLGTSIISLPKVNETPTVIKATYVKSPVKKYIVKFSSNMDKKQIPAKKKYQIQPYASEPIVNKLFKNLPQQILELTEQEYIELKKRNDVVYAEPDYAVSVTDSTYVNPPSEVVSWGYDALKAGTLHKREIFGEGIKIAVIDTGIDLNHPDLRVAGGTSFVGNSYQDDQGHGTRVVGIIAAKMNQIGITGIAPSAQLYAVKALDSTVQGSYS